MTTNPATRPFWVFAGSGLDVKRGYTNRRLERGVHYYAEKVELFFKHRYWFINGSSIGVFIGFGIYKFWHFKTYPNLYAIQSAPWYTELLLDGALVAVVVVVCIILKLIIWKKSKS